jgi:pimeloyl-ACP methyl ester carboxylesterase
LALADFIGDLQDHLGIAGCDVIGNSLGGYLCMQRALQESQSFIRYLADALDPGELTNFVAELERRRDQGQGFPAPLMLVYARQDPMVAPEIGPKLHKLVPTPSSTGWRTAPTSQVDSPGRLAELVTDFLRTDDATAV